MNKTTIQAPVDGLLLGGLLVLLAGCASYPISKSLREQAKPVTPMQVTTHPAAYTGSVVIWGGRVIRTVNDTNGTAIYVSELPLRPEDEQPERYGLSSGRFIVQSPGFIDPEAFKSGWLVTVAGRLTGVQTEPLQETEYTYPVVAFQEVQLWPPKPTFYSYPGWSWKGYGLESNSDWGVEGPNWSWAEPDWDWAWVWNEP